MYGIHRHTCGNYDSDEFKAREMCCFCGGGVGPYDIPSHMWSPREHYDQCTDTNIVTRVDSEGVEYQEEIGNDWDPNVDASTMTCKHYAENRWWCEDYLFDKEEEFNPLEMCCACKSKSKPASI